MEYKETIYYSSKNKLCLQIPTDFPGETNGKTLPAMPRRYKNTALVPGSGRSPGGGHGNPLQYSCLENPVHRRTWPAAVYMVSKPRMRLKQLSMHRHQQESEDGSKANIKTKNKTQLQCL